MGGLKTTIATTKTLVLQIGLMAAIATMHTAPAQAERQNASMSPPSSEITPALPPIARQFAYCAGRLSATMEHQWLLLDPNSKQTEDRREAMISLLDAVTPTPLAHKTLDLRIAAKMAHARLLTLASFNTDRHSADVAQRRADAQLGACVSLLLG